MALIISIILINVTILIYYSRKWIRVSNVPATVAPADTENKLESKSENTLAIVSNNKVDFISRYYTDFEPVQCLGKGGFGVVFQARNKIDDCEYAIKRICLPNREDAREKVMREVKALAKLDHVGIVRYFNAWLEAPPPGWQESMDKHWEHSNVVSSDCSAEHAEKMNAASEQSHKVMADIITKLTNNNSFSAVDCTKKEEESGSYSFDHKDNAKCLDTVFQNSLHLPLEGGDSRDLPGEELWTLPFQQYKNLNSLDFNEIPMKDIDSHGDSFIVFEDSGCGDRSISVEKSAPFGDKQEDGQEGKGLELVLFKKENGSGSKFRPKLCSSSGFKYSPVNSRCTKIYLHIQMQLCQKDNLKDWLNVNSDTRNKFQVLDFFDQIVSAVEYVHDQGLMHRDLKPSNIFFSMDGTIKVGDFGLVTAMAEETIDHTPFDENSPKKHTDQVGTQLYMSPEQIMGLTYNHKVDIFSLGLVLFELLTPFKTQMERLQVMVNVKQHIFPGQFEKEHSEESQFVKLMLSHNPEARPSAVDIKNHSILQAFQPRPEVLRHRRTRNASRTYSTSSSGSLDWSNS